MEVGLGRLSNSKLKSAYSLYHSLLHCSLQVSRPQPTWVSLAPQLHGTLEDFSSGESGSKKVGKRSSWRAKARKS